MTTWTEKDLYEGQTRKEWDESTVDWDDSTVSWSGDEPSVWTDKQLES